MFKDLFSYYSSCVIAKCGPLPQRSAEATSAERSLPGRRTGHRGVQCSGGGKWEFLLESGVKGINIEKYSDTNTSGYVSTGKYLYMTCCDHTLHEIKFKQGQTCLSEEILVFKQHWYKIVS